MYIYCMHQGDAAAPPGARLPLCLQHGGVGVGVVAEEAMAGQPQEHLGSVSPLHTQYTVHCTLYHALQDVTLPPGARYHEAAPVLATAAEPDLKENQRLCAAVCLPVIITILQTIQCCQHRVASQGMVHQRLG